MISTMSYCTAIRRIISSPIATINLLDARVFLLISDCDSYSLLCIRNCFALVF